jgi:hypothetical protein
LGSLLCSRRISVFEILPSAVEIRTYVKVKYDIGWTLFTTNYDRCLEKFWRGDAKVKLDTGFRDGVLDASSFVHPFGDIRLMKLHGSTSWLRRENGEIEEKEYDFDQYRNISRDCAYTGEIVTYPLSQKILYLHPYIGMFYWLNHELGNKQTWIIIGYSFRDPIIRNIFTSNFNKNNRKEMVIFFFLPISFSLFLSGCSKEYH